MSSDAGRAASARRGWRWRSSGLEVHNAGGVVRWRSILPPDPGFQQSLRHVASALPVSEYRVMRLVTAQRKIFLWGYRAGEGRPPAAWCLFWWPARLPCGGVLLEVAGENQLGRAGSCGWAGKHRRCSFRPLFDLPGRWPSAGFSRGCQRPSSSWPGTEATALPKTSTAKHGPVEGQETPSKGADATGRGRHLPAAGCFSMTKTSPELPRHHPAIGARCTNR